MNKVDATAFVVIVLVAAGAALLSTLAGRWFVLPVVVLELVLGILVGTQLLAAGAMGEFGPILLMTVFLSTDQPGKQLAILLAFVVLAVATGLFAVRSAGRGWETLDRTLNGSSQLAVRLVVLLVIALV